MGIKVFYKGLKTLFMNKKNVNKCTSFFSIITLYDGMVTFVGHFSSYSTKTKIQSVRLY